MIKLITAISTAALLAGAAVLVPGLTPSVQAHMYGLKGDRLDAHSYGTACSQQGWPYFETSCLRNMASPTRQTAEVRMIAASRPTRVVAAR